jgi:hypothetical protein
MHRDQSINNHNGAGMDAMYSGASHTWGIPVQYSFPSHRGKLPNYNPAITRACILEGILTYLSDQASQVVDRPHDGSRKKN